MLRIAAITKINFAPRNALRANKISQVHSILHRQVAAVQRNSFTSLRIGTEEERRNRYNRYKVTRRVIVGRVPDADGC
jgi:hypothetical protein